MSALCHIRNGKWLIVCIALVIVIVKWDVFLKTQAWLLVKCLPWYVERPAEWAKSPPPIQSEGEKPSL